MGNWKRVEIIGTCDPSEVNALRAVVCVDFTDDRWTCISGSSGICGLPRWPNAQIRAVGNLGERDYSAASVADALNHYLRSAPSLDVRVHVGGDYESDECIATVRIDEGRYKVCKAEKETIPEIDPKQIEFNLGLVIGFQR